MTERSEQGHGPEHPHRSWTTTVAGWTMLLLTAVYFVVNSASAVVMVTRSIGSGDSEAYTALLILAGLLFVSLVHGWTFAVGRGLLRRRPWARWGALVTCTIFAVLLALSLSTGVKIPGLAWAPLAANLLVIALALHPATARDIWWAHMAEIRPDYVERHRSTD